MKLETCPKCQSKKVELFYANSRKENICMPCLNQIVREKLKNALG